MLFSFGKVKSLGHRPLGTVAYGPGKTRLRPRPTGLRKQWMDESETQNVARSAGKNRLSSVTAAIRLLKAFSDDEAEIGISVLSQRLGIAKSTVHRLVVTLVAEGLLEQNPESGRYRLGIGVFELGSLVRRRMNLSSEARRFLFDLREKANETVLLAIPDHAEIVYVNNLESNHAIRLKSDVGMRRPAFCTALGRAILAFTSEATVDAVLAQPLESRTPKTITDPARIRVGLREVRRRGYAIEDEESELGMRCIAAPIFRMGGEIVGCVGLAGPVQRLSLEALIDLAAPLLETAQAISQRMGHSALPLFKI
jgi:IclR family transcriptional regulator, KDG regulon repressor